MVTDKACAERILDETANAEKNLCDTCRRELKSSAELIRTDDGLICETCYQSLLSPNMKINLFIKIHRKIFKAALLNLPSFSSAAGDVSDPEVKESLSHKS